MIRVDIPAYMLENPHHVNIPQEWEELTPEQYLEFVAVSTLEFTPLQRLYWMTMYFLDIDMTTVKKEHLDDIKISSNIFKVSQYINFLQPETFDLFFVKNLIPVLKIDHEYWYGPQDMLADLVFGEFIDAVDAYQTFCQAESEQEKENYATMLLAILYRPKKKKKRAVYDSDEMMERCEKAKASAHLSQINGVLFWFSACLRAIQNSDEYKDLFDRSTEETETETETKSSGGLGRVLLRLAGTKFGPYEQTALMNLFVILDEMVLQKEDADELKRKYGNT